MKSKVGLKWEGIPLMATLFDLTQKFKGENHKREYSTKVIEFQKRETFMKYWTDFSSEIFDLILFLYFQDLGMVPGEMITFINLPVGQSNF